MKKYMYKCSQIIFISILLLICHDRSVFSINSVNTSIKKKKLSEDSLNDEILETLKGFTDLKVLEFTNCPDLSNHKLSEFINSQHHLEKIYLHNCDINDRVLDSIQNLDQLRVVRISGKCSLSSGSLLRFLKGLQNGIIKKLDFRDIDVVNDACLSTIAILTSIKSLNLSGNTSFTSGSFVKILENLVNLKKFLVAKTSFGSIDDVSSLRYCRNLRVINVSECSNIKKGSFIGILGMLVKLEELYASKTSFGIPEEIFSLQYCRRLRVICLSGCRNIKYGSFSGICQQLLSLEEFDVSDTEFGYSRETGELSKCNSLRVINLSGSKVDPFIFLLCFHCFNRLEELNISGISDPDLFVRVYPLEFRICQNLRVFDLSGCNGMHFDDYICRLNMFVNLEVLKISGNSSESVLDRVGECRKLKVLDLSKCIGICADKFTSILPKLVNLEELNVSGTKFDLKMFSLQKHPNLRVLNVSGCSNIEAGLFANVFDQLVNLEELNVSDTGFGNQEDIDSLQHYLKLRILDVSKCKSIDNGSFAKVLRKLLNLKKFNVSYTKFGSMEEIFSLEYCPELRVLNFHETLYFNESMFMRVLYKLDKLELLYIWNNKLDIHNISALKDLFR